MLNSQLVEYKDNIWGLNYQSEIKDLADLILSSSLLFKSNIFIIPSEPDIEPMTFEKVAEFCLAMGRFFKSKNIRQNERIAVVFHNSTLMTLLFLAIIFNKRVFVPINPNCSSKEIDYILEDAGPALMLYSSRLEHKISECSFPGKKLSIENDVDFIQSILNAYNDSFGRRSDNPSPSSIAEIIYTSGTTGNPKGVVLTHKNLLADSFAVGKTFSFKAGDRFLAVAPLFHNSGQIVTTLAPLWSGGSTTAVRSDLGLSQFWYYVDRFEINWSLGMPAHINFLLEQKGCPNKGTMKGIFCGGAKLEEERRRRFENSFSIPVFNNYGLTETTSIAICDFPDPSKKRPGSVGVPLYINNVSIFSNGKKVAANQVGEIRIKGPNVFKEYLNKPEITSAKLKNGWIYTGDLGYIDDEGYFFIVDRVDNMILVGGENVYPADIENLIPQLEGISEALASPIPHNVMGNEIILVYKMREGYLPDLNVWKKVFSKNLASFKNPKRFIDVRELGLADFPKSPNGKILRKKLKKILEEHLILGENI